MIFTKSSAQNIQALNVFQNEALVATLSRTKNGSLFQYTESFLASNHDPIALQLPKTAQGIQLEGIANLPTYFAGIIPEGFMMETVLNQVRTSRDDLFTILAATGSDAIGDITVRPFESDPPSLAKQSIESQVELLQHLTQGDPVDSARIFAIPGVQPKLSIGQLTTKLRVSDGRASYLIKGGTPQFPGIVANEAACLALASRAGIKVNQARVHADCLVVTRFDRVYVKGQKRPEYLHVEDILQIADRYSNAKYSHDMVEIFEMLANLRVGTNVLFGILELYIFSYLIGNGDLHEKNISLIYDRPTRLWRRSPGYDLLSTLPFANQLDGADRMALPIDQDYGRFTRKDFAAFGRTFGILEPATQQLINKLTRSLIQSIDQEKVALPFESAVIQEMKSRAQNLLES